jgi:Domain of unknown function (DUF4041)
MMTWKLIVMLGAANIGLAAALLWQLVERARVRRRFAGIRDVEREIALRLQAFDRELARQRIELEGELAARRGALDGEVAAQTAALDHRHAAALRELADMMGKTAELQHGYATLVAAHARVRGELTTLEQSSEALAIGLYPPSFPRACPDDYKRRLREARAQQRAMVHGDRAVTYGETWTLGGSRVEGARMQRQYARLLLRAFNGECEAAIATVRWNNLARMAERLTQAFGAINRLGAAMQLQLTAGYRDCKLDELRLEYELDHQRRLELEDEREVRAVELRPLDDTEPRALDDHGPRLARGSVQIQLTPHVPRTADPVEIPLGAARPAPPELSGEESAS